MEQAQGNASSTPGPWQSAHRKTPDGMWNTQVFCAKGETIATLAWYPMPTVDGVTGTYREGNARLIAAAPEQHELLAIFAEWARQVAAREDVPRGIRSAAAGLAQDGRLLLAKATGAAA